MDSRTKFYGPVLAMLSLSAVAFSGFITPPMEEDSNEPSPQEQQEELVPATGSTESSSPSTDGSTPPANTPISDTDNPLPDTETTPQQPADDPLATTPPEPVSFLDWLFIPIPQESPSQDAPQGTQSTESDR